MNQLPGQQDAASLSDCDRSCSDVLAEKAAELTLADAESFGKRGDVAVVERSSLNQFQRARNDRLCAAPGIDFGRTFGPAAQTGPISCRLCRGSGRDEGAILQLGRAGRADWPTINSGGPHAGEKPPVITGIACLNCSVTKVWIEFHDLNYSSAGNGVWRFSDVDEKPSSGLT